MVIAALLNTDFSSPLEAPNGQAEEADRAQPPAGVASPRHKRKQPDPGELTVLHRCICIGGRSRRCIEGDDPGHPGKPDGVGLLSGPRSDGLYFESMPCRLYHKLKGPPQSWNDCATAILHDLLVPDDFARSACGSGLSRCNIHEVVLSFQRHRVLSFQMLFRPDSSQDDGLANNQSRPPPRDVFRLRQLQRAKAAGSLPGGTSSAGTVSTGSRSGSH
jgi:hypothetical protein